MGLPLPHEGGWTFPGVMPPTSIEMDFCNRYHLKKGSHF